MSYPNDQAVANFYSDSKTKFYSNNFFLIAHTDSYNPVTGVNTPKLTAVSGKTDGPYIDSVSVVTSYFFYSPQINNGYFTAPYNYPVYEYPKDIVITYLYPNDDNNTLQYGESRTHYATAATNSLIYISSSIAANTFTFCSNDVCTSANSGVYAGSGQMFATIYYGNAAFGQTGRIGFLTPPNTLQVK
eukprot:gene4750-5206_t